MAEGAAVFWASTLPGGPNMNLEPVVDDEESFRPELCLLLPGPFVDTFSG